MALSVRLPFCGGLAAPAVSVAPPPIHFLGLKTEILG
jgi:hypothetical protein